MIDQKPKIKNSELNKRILLEDEFTIKGKDQIQKQMAKILAGFVVFFFLFPFIVLPILLFSNGDNECPKGLLYHQKYEDSLMGVKFLDFKIYNKFGNNTVNVIKVDKDPKVVVHVYGNKDQMHQLGVENDKNGNYFKFGLKVYRKCLHLNVNIYVRDKLDMIRASISNGNILIKSVELDQLYVKNHGDAKDEWIDISNSKISNSTLFTKSTVLLNDVQCLEKSNIKIRAQTFNSTNLKNCQNITITNTSNINVENMELLKGRVYIQSDESYINLLRLKGVKFLESNIIKGNTTITIKEELKSTLLDLKTNEGTVEIKNILPNWFRNTPNQKQGTILCDKTCENDIHIKSELGSIKFEKIKN